MSRIVTTKAYLFQLQLMHKAISISALFFSLAVSFLRSKENEAESILQINFWIFFVGVLLFIQISQSIFKKWMNKIRTKEVFSSKLKAYLPANVVLWAMTEFSSVLSFIFYFLTDNIHFFFLGILLWIILFFIHWPSRKKVILHLNLNAAESQILNEDSKDLFRSTQ